MQGLLQQAGQPPVEEMPDEEMMDEEGVSPEEDEALQAAIQYIGQRLYSEDIGDQIADTLGQSPKALPRMMASFAMRLSQAADQATGGNIADENLSMLGMLTLNEVAELAQAAGVQVSGADVSAAFKQMVIMFLEDQGIDAAPLAESFAQVDDNEVAALAEQAPADEPEGEMPAEEVA